MLPALLFFNTLFPLIKGGKGDLFAQPGPKYATGGNNLSATDIFGSTNYADINIVTNSIKRGTITKDGLFDYLHRVRFRSNASFDSSVTAFEIFAQQAQFATAVVTGNFTAGSLQVSGNATVSGQLVTSNITSSSGQIDFGNNNLSTTGTISSNNITSLQSQVDSIQQSQWTTNPDSSISFAGAVFVKTLNASDAVNIGNFRFRNGTGVTPAPIDSIVSQKPIAIVASNSIEFYTDTARFGNGGGELISMERGNIAASGTVKASGLNVSGQTQFDSIHVASKIQLGNSTMIINGQTNEIYTKPVAPTDLLIQSVPTSSNNTIINANNGRVGIGTATLSPAIKLEVAGSVSISDHGNVSLFFGRENPNLQTPADQYGEWGIQYWHGSDKVGGNGLGGMNFWKPYGSSGSAIGNGFGNAFLFLQDDGNVGVGCENPAYKLDINGTARAREFRVNLQGCDFVLEEGYNLQELKARKRETLKQKHLQHLFSAKGETEISMNHLLQGLWQNTEEHELYLYQQDERNDAQDEKIEKLEKENTQLKSQMTQQQKEMNELKKEIEELKNK